MVAVASSSSPKHKTKGESKWQLPSNFLQTTPLYGDEDDNRPVLTTQCTIAYFWSLDVKQLSFDNGKVLVEEYPTYLPHSTACHTLSGQLYMVLSPFMIATGDGSYEPAVGVVSQGDVAYRPRHVPNPGPGNAGAANPRGDAWPTLIVEVCYKRSLNVGIIKANQWLGVNTGVHIVVVIKLYGRTANGIAMVALRFERGANNPTYAVSFGDRALSTQDSNITNGLGGAQLVGVGVGGALACNAAGIAQYQFHLPTNLLTVGMPAANVPPNLHYDFDLFTLQQDLLETY